MEPNMSEVTPFRLNSYISKTGIKVIPFPLSYTNREVFEYNYGFFHMHQTEEVWNINITDEFNPSCLNLL